MLAPEQLQAFLGPFIGGVKDRLNLEITQSQGLCEAAFATDGMEQEANAVAQRVIEEIAQDQGAAMAKKVGAQDLSTYIASKSAWTANNALETETLVMEEKRYDYNVTRCRYAEMYQELDMQDLGFIVSCGRDFNFPAGFNKNMNLTRTQTIMQGASHCDFRYEMVEEHQV